jgi:hypothetical protein
LRERGVDFGFAALGHGGSLLSCKVMFAVG